MKGLYIFLFLLVNVITASAQGLTVTGSVRDSATRAPLPGASIVIDYRKSWSAAEMDAKGNFTINLPNGDHVLVIRHVGYEAFKVFIKSGTQKAHFDVLMTTTSSQLEEVIITSKGFDQTIRQPILGALQINIKTLEKLPSAFGELDILRSLQMLPGVSSVGEASNGVNIRGGTTDQTLILLDDTPIFNPTHMFGLFSVIPPNTVNSLDLYKGNVPARFGGRVASVLDISTKNSNLEKIRLEGSISLISNRLMVDVPIIKGKLGVYVAGRGAFNDFILPKLDKQLNNISAKFGELSAKSFWKINQKNTLTFMGYYSNDYFKTDLLTNLPNVVGTDTYYKHITTNGMLRWLHVISPEVTLQTTAIYAKYTPDIGTAEKETGNVVKLESAVEQRQVKSNINYQLANHKFETGFIGTQYVIAPGTLQPGLSKSVNYIATPTEHANEVAWYADDEINFSKKLAVSLGLRYSFFMATGKAIVRNYLPGQPRDDFSVLDSTVYNKGKVSKSYGGPEPRVGVRYALNDRISLKFGYNLMRQYIQVVSNTATPIPTSRWKTSDTHIKPQISHLFTAGFYQSFDEDIYEITLEGYYRNAKNIIDYKPGADFLLQQYPETQMIQGRNRSYGLEMMLSKKKGKLKGWANYTYARSLNIADRDAALIEQVNRGDWYPANYDKPHTFNASLDITVDTHNSFGFTFAYSTGRPYSEPIGFINYQNNVYPFYDKRNNKRIPDYHRLDFAWNIYNPTMKNRRWQGHWTFSIYNLYARKNAYSVFFKTENAVTKSYKLNIFATPIATVAYNFTF
ncbi:TonB-dependent receptor [Dyadobacter sp. CY327]|uniref:TonB-dependent receptor n=1 Tax=Dyadobacter sp. CY327 TaxID=2907301 RepID=UPI001F28EB70|nr:TonB-dependent receptor [Dyadobacter sp. CY327]MCE7071702.1 TonB-dependent receptor [Dyadobacter sp. CY327]